MQKLSHRKVLLLLIITPIFLGIEFILGFVVFFDVQSVAKSEEQNNKLDTYLRTNTRFVGNAESAQRGYLLTGDKKFLETYNVDLEEIQKNEEYYSSLPKEIKARDLSTLQTTSRRKTEEMSTTIRLYDAGLKDSSLAVVNTGYGKRMMDSIRNTSTAIRTEISTQITLEKTKERYLLYIFLLVIAILIVFNIFIVWYTYRKFVRYTDHIETIVSSLQDANERMSQYTALSYHELKTPLRTISGFAQLLKRRYSNENSSSEEHEFVGHITTGIKQMNTTIDEMRAKYLDPTQPLDDIDL